MKNRSRATGLQYQFLSRSIKMTKCDCAPFHVNGPTDARLRGPTATARQRGLKRTGYHRSRPNNNTRHAPRLRGAWRLGAGAGIFLSLLSRHRDCAFVLAIALAPLTAQVTASGHVCTYAHSMLAAWCDWLICLHPFGNLSLCHPNQ